MNAAHKITARCYQVTARVNITAIFIHNDLEAAIRSHLEVLDHEEFTLLISGSVSNPAALHPDVARYDTPG